MASSSTFRQLEASSWPDVESLRNRGYRGGIIRMHRGMIHFRASKSDLAHTLILTAAFSYGWVRLLPVVARVWLAVFEFWVKALHMEARVYMVPQHWTNLVKVSLPFVGVEAGTITPLTWTLTLFVTLLTFAATYWLSEDHAPWSYIIRALVLIQGSALVYFAFASARFPHDIPTYTMGMLSFGVILIGMIPIVLAFTYYPFDFSLGKKIALTALLMGHLTLFFPLQYVLQVYILHHSILFMPLLYFAFGPFVDVLVFVCFYSWAMSWKSRSQVRP